MKNKLVLWMAAAAMMGLLACSYDELVLDNCTQGATKCTEDGKFGSCENSRWVITACPNDGVCDAKLLTCLAPSSITWCTTHYADTQNKVIYGRLLTDGKTSPPSTLIGEVLCGLAGQSIDDYQVFEGSFNSACTPSTSCPTSFEYKADISALPSGSYRCLWTFGLKDEQRVACTKDGPVIKDFSSIPKENEFLKYDLKWDHVIDFEKFAVTKKFDNVEIISNDTFKVSILGAIYDKGEGSIKGKTLVLADNMDGSIFISSTAQDLYIDTFLFDYKAWGDEAFDDKQTLKIYLDDEIVAMHTLMLSGKMDESKSETVTLERKIKKLRIEKGATTSSVNNDPRLLIDNLRWTTQKYSK